MFSHIMVGSNDIARSKKFYDATFAAMGANPGMQDPNGRLIYMHNDGMFLVTPPIDGQPATHANGGTIGFAMTPEQADAWHAAGCANGGMACAKPRSASSISPICATRMATSCARCIAWADAPATGLNLQGAPGNRGPFACALIGLASAAAMPRLHSKRGHPSPGSPLCRITSPVRAAPQLSSS